MGFIVNIWRRIRTKLYIALGFTVLLTLISSAVGVYYFEQSGDLNYLARSRTTAVLDAAWNADRKAERLLAIAREALMGVDADYQDGFKSSEIDEALNELDAALMAPPLVDTASVEAQAVQEAAYDLAEAIDALVIAEDTAAEANTAAAVYWKRIDEASAEDAASARALSTMRQTLLSDNEPDLQLLWDDFTDLRAAGIPTEIALLAEGQGNDEGVFEAQFRLIALRERVAELTASLNQASAEMEREVSTLLSNANAQSASDISSAVNSFDRGRLLLTIISVASVTVATLASWLWVGNGIVRRLSRISERMRNMARGDLETPVPEVGEDEIGELAGALEVFRQQALEVERLNLVEKLYAELREANEELKQMQARLVAQEKLAALGELVSGVAHEISNPLNFVTNFSEGSLELQDELFEMLETYKGAMAEEDADLLEDINQDLSDSLRRVCDNGLRALAIVERMRSLSVEGGEIAPIELNAMLPLIVDTGCEVFQSQWNDFSVQPVFELDSSIDTVPMVEHDFGEAVVSLVSNACYAMRLKSERIGADADYKPVLRVSTRLRDDMVEVRVRDNGSGIANDTLANVFNPFFTTREGAQGAGLGLTIAADVARRLGGDITVDTVYGEYTEFTMSIPASERALMDAQAARLP